MRGRGPTQDGSTRVHAIILTQDRTDVLGRCVDTAMSTMGPNDALTVIDDSCAATAHANAAVLGEAARRSRAHLTYLQAERVHDVMARVTGGPRTLWQSKTAPRDIAPLRNLSLLIAAGVEAGTTVLVDDDIHGFDLDATHRLLDAVDRGPGGVVAGAEIGGMTEQDTVTRLSDAMRLLETKAHNSPVPAKELFRVPPDGDSPAGACGWVSAGYMAFRLPPARLFAFPPGYNEDWLWCLLHGVGGDTCVVRLDQTVLHGPPSLRPSTRDDILFELAGDFIFDCLAECRNGRPGGPDTVLQDLAKQEPDPAVMPLVRTETVLEQRRLLTENGHGRTLPELERYGLSVLGDMLRSGELEIDGNAILGAWSADAAAKHRSFAATLGAATTRVALGTILQAGRL